MFLKKNLIIKYTDRNFYINRFFSVFVDKIMYFDILVHAITCNKH